MTADRSMDNALRKDTEENRRRIEVLAAEMLVLKNQHSTIAQSLDEKHNQNRKDIHNLRGEIQTLSDKFFLAVEEVKKQIKEEVEEIKETIHEMELSSARTRGWWMGIGAAFTFGLDILKHFITK